MKLNEYTFIKGYDPTYTQYGWMCPKCGSVMASWQNCCVHCKPLESISFTCGGRDGK